MVRGQPREDAILASTRDLLVEIGYEALTMDGVAARSRASKATIYRRWKNKAELAKAALDSLDAEGGAVIPDTGRLRSDLVAVMQAMREKVTGPYAAMIQDLLASARHDKDLAAALQSHVKADDLSPFHAVIHRAIQRGKAAPETNAVLVHDVAEALLLRQMQSGSPLDAERITRIVDEVLFPLLGKKNRAQKAEKKRKKDEKRA